MRAELCVETDDKYIPVDLMRRMILRDCPIKNNGPCPRPKAMKTSAPLKACVCECPHCAECVCPSLPPTTTTAATTTTADGCYKSLADCQNLLTFTQTSLLGAQSGRGEVDTELTQLLRDLSVSNLIRLHYQNRSEELGESVKTCLEDLGNLQQDLSRVIGNWERMNSSIEEEKKMDVNVTGLWEICLNDKSRAVKLADQTRLNLTLCEGELTKSRNAKTACDNLLGPSERKNLGKT
jgi:hypothetical protein